MKSVTNTPRLAATLLISCLISLGSTVANAANTGKTGWSCTQTYKENTCIQWTYTSLAMKQADITTSKNTSSAITSSAAINDDHDSSVADDHDSSVADDHDSSVADDTNVAAQATDEIASKTTEETPAHTNATNKATTTEHETKTKDISSTIVVANEATAQTTNAATSKTTEEALAHTDTSTEVAVADHGTKSLKDTASKAAEAVSSTVSDVAKATTKAANTLVNKTKDSMKGLADKAASTTVVTSGAATLGLYKTENKTANPEVSKLTQRKVAPNHRKASTFEKAPAVATPSFGERTPWWNPFGKP